MKEIWKPVTERAVIQIPLSKGYAALVNEEDADLAELKWHVLIDKSGGVYARHMDYSTGKRVGVLMHRVILGRKFEAIKPEHRCDHIDGNGINNCRSNLRIASPLENAWNKSLRRDNTSGSRGVAWNKSRSKWRAYISYGGAIHHLGSFDTIEAAIAVRNAAELTHYGEFSPILSRGNGNA